MQIIQIFMQNFFRKPPAGVYTCRPGHGIQLAAIRIFIIFVGCKTHKASVLKKSETGRRGEDVALDWLRAHGFWLRDRNWRSGHKELDLVMESEQRVHVVEVKTLTPPLLIQPFEKVDSAKQARLASAASHYVAERHVTKEVQFDIVSVVLDGEHVEVEYIPEAFYPIKRAY